jgi:catechol 2,3-dioxygenase-like lactoylglutathione lyase family enzyme
MDERIRIHATTLYARDLDAVAAFYGGALGLRT